MDGPESRGKPALSLADMETFLRTEFPQAFNAAAGLSVEEIWSGGARVRQAYREAFIRPGAPCRGRP